MNNWQYPKFKKLKDIPCWESKWLWRVWITLDNFNLGHNVDIGTQSDLFCHDKLIIGDNVEIGGHCLIYTYNSINNITAPIIIKQKAKIGANSVILPGVVIEAEEKIPAGAIIYINKKGERVIK